MSDQARGQITFELPGRDKKYRAKELTVKQVRQLFELKDLGDDAGLDALIQHFGGAILPKTTNCTIEELEDMRPSELQVIWEKIKEVNAVFFGIATAAGMGELLGRFKDAMLAEFLSSFVSSLSAGIRGTPSGTSDTASSSEP
jgi:hypothetical protein